MADPLRSTPQHEAAVEAALEFFRGESYLSHPKVRAYQGTANGDSPEAWKRDYVAELCRVILAAGFVASETAKPIPFGKDCPKGMVQVEFVGVSPNLRCGPYGWKPSESAFIDVYVDGQRFNIHVGDMKQFGHEGKRGLHVNYATPAAVENRSINALTITLEKKDG